MNKIPLFEKLKVYAMGFARELSRFSYYLAWLLLDPRKFVKVRSAEIKSILMVSGGAIGDIYNVIGLMNSLVDKYPIKAYLLTLKRNRKYVKNPLINAISLEEAKKLIDLKKIDAVALLDPTREREIFDKELFNKILKIKYISSCDSVKLNPCTMRKQYFPISASRKVYPVRPNGPKVIMKLFTLLNFKISKPSFYYTKEGENFAEGFIGREFNKKDNIIVVHPGSVKITRALREGKVPAHLWPEERWAELIDRLLEIPENKVLITGVDSESGVTDKIYQLIQNKKKVIYSVGKIPDLESLASIIKRAKLTISVDTATAHISSQVRTPAVILYSSHSPSESSPIDSSKNVLIYHKNKAHNCRKYACKYCYEVHMKSISVREVYSSISKLLGITQ